MSKAKFFGCPVKIKVIGLGGSGCNAVTRMAREGIRGVEFIAMNTDIQSLALNEAPVRLQLGRIISKGAGAGGNHEVGREAAEESRDEITALISQTDIIFIACGMGGGTGTGAAPIVAEIARNVGALTIAVVSSPFSFEGRHRAEVAEQGIAALLGKVDSLVTVTNDRLLELHDKKFGVDDAFQVSDGLLRQGVRAVAEVLNTPGIINLDFADIKAILKSRGSAFMSTGVGRGHNRSVEAAQAALASPVLDVPIAGATGILFNIVGSDNLTLHEVNRAAELIRQVAAPEANIIFGVAIDPTMDPIEVKITLIAAGFSTEKYPIEYRFDRKAKVIVMPTGNIEEKNGVTEVQNQADLSE